jgi:hypothetical protein
LYERNKEIEDQKDLKYGEVKSKQNNKYYNALFKAKNHIIYQYDPDQELCKDRTLKNVATKTY